MNDKRIAILQSQQVSYLSVITKKFYDLKYWMCGAMYISQIRSHSQLAIYIQELIQSQFLIQLIQPAILMRIYSVYISLVINQIYSHRNIKVAMSCYIYHMKDTYSIRCHAGKLKSTRISQQCNKMQGNRQESWFNFNQTIIQISK